MGIVITIAVLATLAFIGWLIFRAVRVKQVKAHHITYGIAVITAIYTYGFFLTMDLAKPIKILASIIMGIVLIVLAASIQRRRQSDK